VLSAEDLEAVSVEVESAEYDVEELKTRRRGRPAMGSSPTEVAPVRLDTELREAVDARADSDKTTSSEVIRQTLN
jgi:CRISPR-associated endonuclease/helicase Cas3